MTPKEKEKEKAKELKDNFQKQVFFDVTDERLDINEAKGLALLAVDLMISNIYKSSTFEIYYLNDDKMNEVEAINYWQEVKQEIENL